MKPPAFLVDIDGTIARRGDRDIYDASKCHLDEPITEVITLIRAASDGYDDGDAPFLIVVSGRHTGHQAPTEAWLAHHFPDYDELHLRQEGDWRSDEIVKREIYERRIAPRYEVRAVFDDRLRVARMWRSLGLPLFYVGDFTDF